MARLDALPSIDIIRGFKGVLDFYMWKGLPCVRKWPVRRPGRRTEAEIASAELFGRISTDFGALAPLALEAFQDAAKDQPRTARDLYITAVYGHLHERTVVPPPPPGVEMYDAYVCARDKKAPSTMGGTFTRLAWRTRDINDEHADTKDLCSITANQITLDAGTYRCSISCPASRVNRHKARLYNVTDAAELLIGTTEEASNTHFGHTCSLVKGRFTLNVQKTLEVQHYSESTKDGNGFGAGGIVGDEIFTIAEFWREIP